MPQFQPDQVTYGDLSGYGAWDIGHGREHLAFIQTLSQRAPPVNIPNFDLLSFLTAGQARNSMLLSHWQAHTLVHAALGITTIDLSRVNLDDENDFYNWLGYHASVHAAIRQALGLT